MAFSKLSKSELLEWINDLTECQYQKVEHLSDGVGFCYLFDMIHPKLTALSKLDYRPKYNSDYFKNLEQLDYAFKKAGIQKQLKLDKLSEGKLNENLQLLQWFYTYSNKKKINISLKDSYEKRKQVYLSQKPNNNEMNSHLIPYQMNIQPYQNQQNYQDQYQQSDDLEVDKYEDDQLLKRFTQINTYIQELEKSLKTKMEFNWNLLYALEDIQYQRNTLWQGLAEIEQTIMNQQGSQEMDRQLKLILSYQPSSFHQI